MRRSRSGVPTLSRTFQEIVHLFAITAEVDREIDRVNASAPDGMGQRLRHVENEARNLDFSRDCPSLAKTVELRDWDNSGRMIWPPRHFGSLAAAFAQSMITPAAAAGASRSPRRSAPAKIQHLQAQLAEFYQQATENQEARQNAGAVQRFGSRS